MPPHPTPSLLLAAALLLPLAAPGCARFATSQTDTSHENSTTRQITTKASAYTLFAGKSQLASWKASQTDKTQGASVGTLTQETSSTNIVAALDAIARILSSIR